MRWEQSVQSEANAAPDDAWINRLLEALEGVPPAPPLGGSDLPIIEIDICSPERCERERQLAAARLAEWTV